MVILKRIEMKVLGQQVQAEIDGLHKYLDAFQFLNLPLFHYILTQLTLPSSPWFYNIPNFYRKYIYFSPSELESIDSLSAFLEYKVTQIVKYISLSLQLTI